MYIEIYDNQQLAGKATLVFWAYDSDKPLEIIAHPATEMFVDVNKIYNIQIKRYKETVFDSYNSCTIKVNEYKDLVIKAENHEFHENVQSSV